MIIHGYWKAIEHKEGIKIITKDTASNALTIKFYMVKENVASHSGQYISNAHIISLRNEGERILKIEHTYGYISTK